MLPDLYVSNYACAYLSKGRPYILYIKANVCVCVCVCLYVQD
jgi:hypothetical protein